MTHELPAADIKFPPFLLECAATAMRCYGFNIPYYAKLCNTFCILIIIPEPNCIFGSGIMLNLSAIGNKQNLWTRACSAAGIYLTDVPRGLFHYVICQKHAGALYALLSYGMITSVFKKAPRGYRGMGHYSSMRALLFQPAAYSRCNAHALIVTVRVETIQISTL